MVNTGTDAATFDLGNRETSTAVLAKQAVAAGKLARGEAAAPPTRKRKASDNTKKTTATAANDDDEDEVEGASDKDLDTTEKKKARKTKAKARGLDVDEVAAQRRADLLLLASGAVSEHGSLS